MIVLTIRQREVVGLIAQGKSYDEIGASLEISSRTAKAHTEAIRHKLGVAKKRLIPAAYQQQTGENPLDIDTRELVAA